MKLALPLFAAVPLLAAAACGSTVRIAGSGADTSGGTSTGTGATTTGTGLTTSDTGGAGGAPSDVNGSLVRHYHGEGPPIAVTLDLSTSGFHIEALVQEGGTWKTFHGKGHADGTFTIPSVPAGLFVLPLAGSWVYTTARQLDLGTDIAGRPDAVPSVAPTLIAGDLQNLSPWQVFDTVQWLNPNGGGGAFNNDLTSPGGTALNGEPSSWSGALLDASKGDRLYVTDLTAHPAAGTEYLTIARFLSFGGLEQKDRALTTVTGTFVEPPATSTIAVDFRVSEFVALASAVHPGAGSHETTLRLSTLPAAASVGTSNYPADLLQLGAHVTDVNLGTVPYANPFPASWGTYLYAGVTWSVSFPQLGTSGAVSLAGTVSVTMPASQAGAGPIRPQVTPVQNLLVNGQDASGPLAGVSLIPTLTWSPPAVGTPTGYRIVVTTPVVIAGMPSLATVTEIASIPTTSLTLPPGALEPGHSYIFTVTAIVSDIDSAAAPFRGSSTLAAADAVTGLIMP